ncbi:RHS repeat domain-containing protein [Leptothrix discophora]|uniref:YD repeat-containing protein n=1 Tax=Leptothrix discophora TaxID=89 RepID=A0ABT9G381_LEPDI|nr:hypothetical protein [Leptothrix discophora]MDP4300946.1 hypothetical protein [Leptothrix discophora]
MAARIRRSIVSIASLAVISLTAGAQNAPARFISATASGADWKCGSFSGTYSGVSEAISALMAYTASCPYLASLYVDTCSAVPANVSESGRCDYAYNKTAEGGGDHVGGSAAWTFCAANSLWVAQAGACVQIVDRYAGKPQSCEQPRGGNPIYPLTATKRQTESLTAEIGGIRLSAQYDSRRNFPAEGGAELPVSRPAPSFGSQWDSNLHKSLIFQTGLNGVKQGIQASRGGGVWVDFLLDASGLYRASTDVRDRLVATPDGWRYIDAAAQSVETYRADGRLVDIKSADGTVLTYLYSDVATPLTVAPVAGLIIGIQDQTGRVLQFAYEQDASTGVPRIKSITDPDGRTILVSYLVGGMLSQFTWQDSTSRQYVYELPGLPWALTGILDENASRHSTYTYDVAGRAIGTELAGGVNRFTASYVSVPTWNVSETFDATAGVVWRDHAWGLPVAPSMTTPNGSITNYGVEMGLGIPRVASQSQPAGAGCAAASSSTYYDTAGLVRASVDFNAVKTCFDNDSGRRLETARVEGLNHATEACQYPVSGNVIPAGNVKRKISTQWHPIWNLKTRLAEPKKITTWVYNGQPDPTAGNVALNCAPATAVLPDGNPIAVLCKQVEQATTDVNGSAGFAATPSGAARVTSYTYNAFGQVLTARDALGNLTTYAYYADSTVDHTLGDLQSITNAAGHITQFTVYDRAGRLKRSVDPNGVVTNITYTPRGWVNSVAVSPPTGAGAAQTTSYLYDGVGQLKEATLPDATKITYSYDAAHRLTGIKDGAGNTITYTLDNAGNRTAEALKDPAGVLARNVTRVYDALGRVQSVTGVQP